jgi:CubicO group peptidase (beta-lactamase class C family)
MAARIDAYLTSLAHEHRFSGSVLLARQGTILLRKGYGMADWSRLIPNTSSTTFIMPGTDFEFATAAVLQLMDAGKVHEQDHLCAYLPNCPAPLAPITIHQLVIGTAGLHNYQIDPANFAWWGRSVSLAQLAPLVTNAPTDWRPGTNCCSGNGDALIEKYLVERVTGGPFGTYVRRHILGPLGLSHTGYYLHHPPRLLPHAIGYLSGLHAAPYTLETTDFSTLGGTVFTTIADYYHWEQALHTGRVLSRAATARIISPSFAVCPPQCYGGYSLVGATVVPWGIVTWQHHRIVSGGGDLSAVGFQALDAYFPDGQITVVALRNQDIFPAGVDTPTIATLIFGP